MATLQELAARLMASNPSNEPMRLGNLAKIFWPERDDDWHNKKVGRNNSGARRGAVVAAGMAGRMQSAGLLRRHIDEFSPVSMWVWIRPKE